jgi:hypothetical protein
MALPQELSQPLLSQGEGLFASFEAPLLSSVREEDNPVRQLDAKLNQVCLLLLQLTDEQRETNTLLRRLINEDNPGSFQILQLSNQDNYTRFLVVLENDRSRPRMSCPLCNEDVEITTNKKGGCKQQSFCGDYVVCNECTNDALGKVIRCPLCCEAYSNIPVPLCSHLDALIETEGHLARKGSGSGCPVCSGKLVKDKCALDCPRKDLANYHMAKSVLSERVFVLVKNPEACTNENDDRPCSHYCRCTKHNILFTNRNRGARCRECTKESTRERNLGKRMRSDSQGAAVGPVPTPLTSSDPFPFPPLAPGSFRDGHQSAPTANAVLQHARAQQEMQQQLLRQQMFPEHQPSPQEGLERSFQSYPNSSAPSHWLPLGGLSFNNVKELGRVHLDDLLERIPYSEGVKEFGKRVTSNLTNTLGFAPFDMLSPNPFPPPSPPSE